MKKRVLPLSKVYRLLEPGPVVLITTSRQGKANIMTQSWHTVMEFNPPLVGCVISERNYSFELLKTTRECAINIPTQALAAKVVNCGNTSGRKIDKFRAYSLTPAPASCIEPPLIADCYANLECRVVDTRLVKAYNFFILEVVKAWIDPLNTDPRTIHHRGKGEFMVAGRTITLPSRMK
ncbi:MAG: flavin reductase family protein [Thiobacillaceae bacterium]